MKTFLLCLMLCVAGCFAPEKSIQVQMLTVTLKAMEPYYRGGQEAGCKITWWDDYNNVEYTSFSHAPEYFIDGVLNRTYELSELPQNPQLFAVYRFYSYDGSWVQKTEEIK